MERAISGGLENIVDRVVPIWKKASEEYAKIHGVPLSPVVFSALGVLGAGATVFPWKTVLQRYTLRGAAEVLGVVQAGIHSGMNPDDLARRLRKYVLGSEPLQNLFVGDSIDLHTVPANLRGSAQKMAFNATRIAFTEIHNARSLAEIRLFIADPLVDSVRWILSPNRGNWQPPDECDLLARTDFYGLGTGIYPVTRVPSTTHPFCRCERMPVRRSPSEAGEPKSDPALLLDPLDPNSVKFPGGGSVTASAAGRARRSAWESISNPMS